MYVICISDSSLACHSHYSIDTTHQDRAGLWHMPCGAGTMPGDHDLKHNSFSELLDGYDR
jgi:hypothetical protein